MIFSMIFYWRMKILIHLQEMLIQSGLNCFIRLEFECVKLFELSKSEISIRGARVSISARGEIKESFYFENWAS